MTDGICFVGLDVHARKTAGAAVVLGSGDVFRAQIPGSPLEAIDWMQSLPGPVRAVYEAGPTGFGLARAARAAGLEVMVCSPGAIPRQPGDRIKTDMRDALKLARLHAAGQLRPVSVPSVELEALRDLVRVREDLRGDLMAARHRISKLLLRRGLIYAGPGSPWESQRHAAWMGTIRLAEPLSQVVLGEYLACHEVLLARRDRLDRLIDEQSREPEWAALIGRLRCLRGVDTLTAVGLLAEIGDFSAFSHPKQLASFLGLVPSENSTGERRRQRRDHQGRQLSRAQAADRGRLALPPPARGLTHAPPPPGRPATRGDRGRLARAAASRGPLGAPRRTSREAPHHRRGRCRARARVLYLGDRPPARLAQAHIPFEAWAAAGARHTGPAMGL